MNISKGLTTIGKAVSKHGPEILIALGIAGFVSAAISAVKNTPKALEAIHEAEESVDTEEPLTTVEKVKVCWKYYIFPIIIGILSALCIICAYKIEYGRTVALLSLCKVSEETADRLSESTKEVVGEDKYQKIKDHAAKKEMQENPMDDANVYLTGTGTTLYYECYSGRYFRANRDFVDRARNIFIGQLQDYDTLSVNNYLECFDLPPIDDLTTGRMLGWRLDDVKRMCGGHMPELEFTYDEIRTGEVCGYMRLECDPQVNYDRSYS